MTAENWQKGATYPLERQVIHTGAGHPRWHCLTVLSQREDAAEAWLAKRGVYAFHPVKTRRTMIRGRVQETFPGYLPGYVFARFPARPIRHRVLACPFITGALAMQTGQWGVIVPASMRGLHSMRKPEDADRDAAQRRADTIRKGDRVRILSGLTGVGQVTEVVEIRAARARVRLRMFGSDIPAEVPLDQLERVGLLGSDE